MRYYSKLHTIEAVQWMTDGDHEAVKPLKGLFTEERCPRCKRPWKVHGELERTVAGMMAHENICPGDYIVTANGITMAMTQAGFESSYHNQAGLIAELEALGATYVRPLYPSCDSDGV